MLGLEFTWKWVSVFTTGCIKLSTPIFWRLGQIESGVDGAEMVNNHQCILNNAIVQSCRLINNLQAVFNHDELMLISELPLSLPGTPTRTLTGELCCGA